MAETIINHEKRISRLEGKVNVIMTLVAGSFTVNVTMLVLYLVR